jgi:hypothetical protein
LELDFRDTPNDRGLTCRSCDRPAAASKGANWHCRPTAAGDTHAGKDCNAAILLKNSYLASSLEHFGPVSLRRVAPCPAGRTAMQISPMSLCVALKAIGVACAFCVLQLGTGRPRRPIKFFNRIQRLKSFATAN